VSLHDTTAALEGKIADANAAAAAAAERTRDLATLQSRCFALQEQLQCEVQAAADAIATSAVLRADADSARSAAASAEKQVAAYERQVAELRQGLGGAQAQLSEYQTKDVEVYSRIREAMESSEQARISAPATAHVPHCSSYNANASTSVQHKLACDAASVRERQLEAEITMLRGQLSSATAAAKCHPASAREDTTDLAHARRDVTRAQRALVDLEDTVVDLRANTARLEREKRSLREQLDAVHSAAAAPPSSTPAVAAVDSLRQVLEAQKARDVAQQDADIARRALERAKVEHGVALAAVHAELDAARSSLTSQAAVCANAKAEAASHQRQLDSVKRDLSHAKAAQRQKVDELRSLAVRMRGERSTEVCLLAGKLEAAMVAYSRSVADTERMLTSKDALLQRYKAEAQTAAAKVASLQVRSSAFLSPPHSAWAWSRGIDRTYLVLCGRRTQSHRVAQSTQAQAACGAPQGARVWVQVAAENQARESVALSARLGSTQQDNEVLRSELDAALADADASRAAADRHDAAVEEAEAARAEAEGEARRRRHAEMALEQAQLQVARSLRRGGSGGAHAPRIAAG
jgi:chromosome segregation ATPase